MYEYALTDKIKSPACVCDVDFGMDRSIILRVRHEGLDKLGKDGFIEVHKLDNKGRRVGSPIIGTIANNSAPLQIPVDTSVETKVDTTIDPLAQYSEIERAEIMKALELVRSKPQS